MSTETTNAKDEADWARRNHTQDQAVRRLANGVLDLARAVEPLEVASGRS
jgi:hypothetical protein